MIDAIPSLGEEDIEMAGEMSVEEMPMPMNRLTVPQGFEPPENATEEGFEVVARVRMEDGELVVDSINGVAMTPEPQEPVVEKERTTMAMSDDEDAPNASGMSLREAMSKTLQG